MENTIGVKNLREIKREIKTEKTPEDRNYMHTKENKTETERE